jgi:LacI family transcriptional regulator
VRPALTSVRQPLYEMGRRGMELLLSLVESPRPVASARLSGTLTSQHHVPARTNPIRIQLPSALVVRESCGAHLQAAFAGKFSDS